jgi:polysaccharide chain length determinant protein (PEP-CTERM system associated)
MVFRRKWAIMAPTALGLVLAAGVALAASNPKLAPKLLPPKYRAVALLRRRDLALSQSAPSSLISPQPAVVSLDVLRQEILTWDNLDRVIRQTKLDAGLVTARDWQGRYADLREAISIRSAAQSRGVDLVEIAVIDTTPAIAARIANAIADNYVEQSKKSIRSDTLATVNFLEKGRDEYLQKLREAEGRLADYREKHFADLPTVREGIWNQLLGLRTQVEAQKLQLQEAERSLEMAKKALDGVPETLVVSADTAVAQAQRDVRVVEIENRLKSLREVLNAARLRYTDEHYSVKRLQAAIAQAEQELQQVPAQEPQEPVTQPRQQVPPPNPAYQQLNAKRLDLEREVKGRQSALFALNSQISATEKELEKMAGDQKGFLEIQQDIDEVTKIYDTYRTNLVAARTRLEVDAGDYGTQVEMVSKAFDPAIPYRQVYDKLVVLCLIGGLAAGIALMFGLEFSDHSLRSREDAEDFLGIPVLGSIAVICTRAEVARQKRGRRLALAALSVVLLLALGAGLWLWADAVKGLLKNAAALVPGREVTRP